MDLLGKISVVFIPISKQEIILAPYSYGKFVMGYAKVDISDYAKSKICDIRKRITKLSMTIS